MGKIISIVNQKGGVAKTTTSINLSAAVASLGHKVLLVDIDPQGNACSGLGIEKEKLDYTIYDLLLDEVDIQTTIIPTYKENLFVIPSNSNLVGAQVELINEMGREYRLKKALDTVVDEYDYIFIDCPPTLGILTLNALAASHSVLIPIQCEFLALIKKNLNPNLEIEGALLTMYDSRTNLSSDVVKEVVSFFKEKTYKTMIPRNVRLSEAPSHGLAIYDYDSECIGARSYKEFSLEFLEKCNKEKV